MVVLRTCLTFSCLAVSKILSKKTIVCVKLNQKMFQCACLQSQYHSQVAAQTKQNTKGIPVKDITGKKTLFFFFCQINCIKTDFNLKGNLKAKSPLKEVTYSTFCCSRRQLLQHPVLPAGILDLKGILSVLLLQTT